MWSLLHAARGGPFVALEIGIMFKITDLAAVPSGITFDSWSECLIIRANVVRHELPNDAGQSVDRF